MMVAIPTSLVATFIMMYAAGFTLNLMTLLAMSLVIGILVDDSIVVLENIYRYMEHGIRRKRAPSLGGTKLPLPPSPLRWWTWSYSCPSPLQGVSWATSCGRLRWS
ncbi:MAG: efflux RND transporter permease subunit [Saprospiraceae bacterium]|nr:efflux RND transporter permease subunit [Saprospiraceae bacterium]